MGLIWRGSGRIAIALFVSNNTNSNSVCSGANPRANVNFLLSWIVTVEPKMTLVRRSNDFGLAFPQATFGLQQFWG